MTDHRSTSPHWQPLTNLKQFDQILERSKSKPALVLKYHPNTSESELIKKSLDQNWNIGTAELDMYLVDVSRDTKVSHEVTEVAGVDHEYPQVLLFADGVTMYDESHDLINVKKIKIALKIINRTFKWMETRV